MCVDVSGGRKGTVPQPFLNLLHRYAVHHHQAGAAVAQIVETDVLQPVLGQQPVEVLRHEVRADQLAFLIGADEIQILGAVTLLEQLTVKLLFFLLLQKFFFHSRDQRQSTAAGLVLHHIADHGNVLAVHQLFRHLVIDGDGLALKVDRRPLQPQYLAAAQTVVGCNEDAKVQRVILRDFQQLLDFILGVEVGPEAVLLRAVNFQHRVGFQIILADGILERLAEDGVVVNDRVGSVPLQQNLLLKLIQHLRRDLAQLQAHRLKILRDTTGDHPIVADKGCRLDGCLVNLHPLVEIVQKQHLRLADGLEMMRQGLGGFSIYFFVGSAPPCGQLPGLIIVEQYFPEHGFCLALVAPDGQTCGDPLDLPLAVGIIKIDHEIETSIFLLDRPCSFHHKPPLGQQACCPLLHPQHTTSSGGFPAGKVLCPVSRNSITLSFGIR